MHLPAEHFKQETDHRVCRGVYRRNPPEMQRKMAAKKENRTGYKTGLNDWLSQTPNEEIGRHCERIKNPATRNEKPNACPSRNSAIHGAPPSAVITIESGVILPPNSPENCASRKKGLEWSPRVSMLVVNAKSPLRK